MSHSDKSRLYQELKTAGVQFDKQYREYTTDELQAAVDKLRQIQGQPAPVEEGMYPTEELFYQTPLPEPEPMPEPQYPTERLPPPAAPDTEAGLRLNTVPEGEPIRTDENGFIWYQDEVRKPSFPQPRKRRVLRYMDTGTKVQTVQSGQFIETFEVAGDERREAEARITLPSYQVGIYRDPRFPFKIHIYNENRGFDLFEVQDFYGGADLVPLEIKRVYIENVLCYDIRTTVRAIESEARRLDLMRGARP